MLVKRLKIINRVKFVRNLSDNDHLCSEECRLYDIAKRKECYQIIHDNCSLSSLCIYANKHLEEDLNYNYDYVPLDYVIKKV